MIMMPRQFFFKFLYLTAFLHGLAFSGVTFCLAADPELESSRYIAHAGGGINHETYTNSLEALNTNYDKGFRFFEVDFSWTSDGKLVAIHDWQGVLQSKFSIAEGIAIPTEAEFIGLTMKNNLTQLGLEEVLIWAAGKGDAYIVTDVKDHNLKALGLIAADFKEFNKYVVPQVYSYREYEEARDLGYERIILTLYRMKVDPYEVLAFAKKYSPFAVTMPWKMARTGLAYHISRAGTRVYVHTVNEMDYFNMLKGFGVFGVYTDFISPSLNAQAPQNLR
ncbi:glycerophosphodiester phosphodiesterase family protein [Desulfuromonas sp. TF]|uniref:glycerophosphodiester phosphodiesterase family protein n=1 Tax=Desulfuromonas sp. TF TaxID=1232410 RepID=UPI000417DD6F|nr:glycerophosphodiester phosphodiesterase family protein [Desulfuromonas sp. TF]